MRPDKKQNIVTRVLGGLLGVALIAPHGVFAAGPSGESVASGSATITRPNATTTLINQATSNVIINWSSYSIPAGNLVQYVQPSTTAAALNRVTGTDPSTILGTLQANGRVFLLNPNGILFGVGSVVNVGGLVASTLSMTDSDFLNKNYRFTPASGTPNSFVVNQGSITANAGDVVLLAPIVSNEGTITTAADSGRVGLSATTSGAVVNLDGAGLINFVIPSAPAGSNGVQISSAAYSNTLSSAITNNLSAVSVTNNGNGTYTLNGAGAFALHAGTINSNGTSGGIAISGDRGVAVGAGSSTATLGGGISITSATGNVNIGDANGAFTTMSMTNYSPPFGNGVASNPTNTPVGSWTISAGNNLNIGNTLMMSNDTQVTPSAAASAGGMSFSAGNNVTMNLARIENYADSEVSGSTTSTSGNASTGDISITAGGSATLSRMEVTSNAISNAVTFNQGPSFGGNASSGKITVTSGGNLTVNQNGFFPDQFSTGATANASANTNGGAQSGTSSSGAISFNSTGGTVSMTDMAPGGVIESSAGNQTYGLSGVTTAGPSQSGGVSITSAGNNSVSGLTMRSISQNPVILYGSSGGPTSNSSGSSASGNVTVSSTGGTASVDSTTKMQSIGAQTGIVRVLSFTGNSSSSSSSGGSTSSNATVTPTAAVHSSSSTGNAASSSSVSLTGTLSLLDPAHLGIFGNDPFPTVMAQNLGQTVSSTRVHAGPIPANSLIEFLLP